MNKVEGYDKPVIVLKITDMFEKQFLEVVLYFIFLSIAMGTGFILGSFI